jgi:hypothetical protein
MNYVDCKINGKARTVENQGVAGTFLELRTGDSTSGN